jgi:hypothetical protein
LQISAKSVILFHVEFICSEFIAVTLRGSKMTPVATQDVNVLSNGVKLVGESLIPGASLLMDGKFVEGAAHTLVGLGARAALGPIGLVVVCTDSFSKSVTNKSLYDYASEAWKSRTFLKSKKVAATEEAATEAVATEEAAAA